MKKIYTLVVVSMFLVSLQLHARNNAKNYNQPGKAEICDITGTDFGDCPNSYSTLLSSNGPRHTFNPTVYLGDTIDVEQNGFPSVNSDGDDLNNLDDEDGVIWPWAVQKGNPVAIIVKSHSNTGLLNAWIDYNRDGDFGDPGEKIFTDLPMLAGNNNLTIVVPNNAGVGMTYARFRISTQPGLNYFGAAIDGEVEDYQINITTIGNGLKWLQPFNPNLPGLHNHGYINGQNTVQVVLADDWRCNGGQVAAISWWGNYEVNNNIEIRGQGIDHFHLAIHSSSPAANCLPVEPPVWTADIPLYEALESSTGVINPEGSTIYQYSYFLNEPFNQTEGNLYWLEISAVAVSNNAPPLWRWQESLRSDNPVLCGAVTKTFTNGSPSPWSLISFPNHPFANLAFEIHSLLPVLEFGDAPDPGYPTLRASNGARHWTMASGYYLGSLIDLETNGQPTIEATGDDTNTSDDEDGVAFSGDLITGQSLTITVTASVAQAYLQGWIDFNCDGDWYDLGEHVIINHVTTAGPNTFTIPVPASAVTDTTYLRFRFSSVPNLNVTGLAPNGEVEDYMKVIKEPQCLKDFGDCPNSYSTLLTADGARHVYNMDVFMGDTLDPEPDGIPSPNADGDDLAALDDEDGVTWPWAISRGSPCVVVVKSHGPGAYLSAWFDFNIDGDFADAGEKIFSDVPLAAGDNNLTFVVPASAGVGNTFARFRLSTQTGLNYFGEAGNGEVEDYKVSVVANAEGLKWKQPFNPNLPGLHDHGYMNGQTNLQVVLADDWLCNGGMVTDIA